MSALVETQLLGSGCESFSTLSMSANNISGFTFTSDPSDKRRHHARWKGRTKLEKRLCLVTVISLFVVLVLAVALSVLGYRLQHKPDTRRSTFSSQNADGSWSLSYPASGLCLTPGCVKAASEVLSHLDETVDPCDDFYRFACGGWMERQEIPDDRSEISKYDEADDEVDLKLRALLEKKLDGSENSLPKIMKGLYATCMDLDQVEKAGSRPLKRILKNLGGWPVVEGGRWGEFRFDWVDSLISLRRMGYNHNILLSLSVTLDPRNNTVHIIRLDQPSLGMPDRSYLVRGLNDSSTSAYFRKMVKAARLLGAEEETAERELLEALNFEITLANYSWPKEERRNMNKLYNRYTVQNLQDLMPQVPWLEYFNGLLNDEINEDETLIVAVPNFVVKFANLISSTEKRVVANYMMWRVIDSSLSLMSKEFRDVAQVYRSILSGTSRERPRWKQCLSRLQGHLGVALSSYYVRHYFKEESKQAASTFVKYIHKEFLKILDKKEWMDKETKKQAKEKAVAMKYFVGYPKELLNNTAVMEVYKTLKITNGSYFDNILRLRKWSKDEAFSRLRKPSVKGDWKEHGSRVVLVNAFSMWNENNIEIPGAILQGHFFSKDRPHYLNFGAIGSVIGHEITHGFDDQGRQYDKDGNNVNWWDKSTDERFKEKAQCVIDQYSNYTAENGMKLNGINTQGENIADIGGLKEAYWAYHSWTKENGPDPMLPGLKYVPNQLFWISAAHVWCAKIRPESLKRRIISGYHSPPRFRVIGPVSNLAEFARDFSCSPDSPMNKRHKCEVW